MSTWSGWRDLISIKDFGKIGNEAGVYKIRRADSTGQPISIERFLDKDADGLLAIGESNNLARRIKEFHNAYEGIAFMRHSAGDRLFLIRLFHYSSWKTSGQSSKFQITFMKVGSKGKAKMEEEKLLKRYFIRYGELPPLNSNLPDKGDWPRPEFD